MRTSEFKKLAGAAAPVPVPVPGAVENVFVAFNELPQHGVRYSRVHLRRLIGRGLFPAPVMLSPNRQAWRLSDIVAWKASRPTAPVPPPSAAA